MTPQSNWIQPAHVTIPADLQTLLGGDRLLGEALVRREIIQIDQVRAYLDPQFYTPADGSDLPDLDLAVERIIKALKKNQHIGIWGDFDVDGQTSTSLLVSALTQLGARISYHIPIRATESHGINLPGLENFLSQGIDLLISCDTGITAFDAAQACRAGGVDFIITDHHTLSDSLPDALAVVNPQRLPLHHPLSYLCGVGCAFKLVEKLYQNLNRADQAAQFLDLVTLGTIADIALLKGDNRFLVQKGLQLIRSSPRPALKAILHLAETSVTRLSEEHISFVLAPRMNAVGRLSDANPMVPFLLSSDINQAGQFALELEKWNGERKVLCDQVFKSAQFQIESNRSLLDDPILVLSQPEWPTGVVGIVASRLVELYHRPCILLSSPPGQPTRGSARSVDGINITQAIAAQKVFLIGYGGHPMAAGLAVQPDQLPQFTRSIARYIQRLGQNAVQAEALSIDAMVPLQDISINLVERISKLAPFGAGNPPLKLAANNLTIREKNPIGKKGEHLKLVVEDASGTSAQVIWWQGAGSPLPEGRFNLAYTARIGDYRGSPQVQVEWIDFQEIQQTRIAPEESTLDIELEDWRHPVTPTQLKKWLELKPAVWGEGQLPADLPAQNRLNLQANPLLVIWNAPPGIMELKQALEAVKPGKIILSANNQTNDQPADFLKELSGLVRYSLHENNGLFEIQLAAARLGHRVATIRCGINWLCSKGYIKIMDQLTTDRLLLQEPGSSEINIEKTELALKMVLKETSAYRQFYGRARVDLIITAALKMKTEGS